MSIDNNQTALNQYSYGINSLEYNSSSLKIRISSGTYDLGITFGNVIRWDENSSEYVKSIADTAENAEVVGIVESMNSDNSLNVVVQGTIQFAIYTTLIDVDVSIPNLGGNDIYFLSGISAGFMENIAPRTNGHIIKPIFYKAFGVTPTTVGVVRNYIGYKIRNN